MGISTHFAQAHHVGPDGVGPGGFQVAGILHTLDGQG